MKYQVLAFLIFYFTQLNAQNKSGYTWIVGNNASYGKFDGTSNKPQTGSVYTTNAPNYPYIFDGGHSNICDSATGGLLFMCNGMLLFDTTGNIIENGDNLVPSSIYHQNAFPSESSTQSSLILQTGENGKFYVFIATVSDSTHAKWFQPNASKTPFDMLLYNIVDMNANGGMGKVIKKNIPLIANTEMSRTNMQACRHSNGVDWWLLKKTGLDSNNIVRFLVTKDSIFGPYFQKFTAPNFGIYDATGQCCFSKDGTKYASVQGKSNKLFVADFNRCTGELYNPQVFNIPIDSTSYPPLDNDGSRDSISAGVCFSSNNQFIYISKWWNIYQFELNQIDSSLAWYNVKRGTDTTWNAFESYRSLTLGIENRIYIGKGAGGFKQFSVIDYPDLKGSACGFCRKCFRVDNALGGLNSPPNMPDFNLGASPLPCWPLEVSGVSKEASKIKCYPNPASTSLTIELTTNKKGLVPIEMYNMVGKLVFKTDIQSQTKVQINISSLPKGVYVIRCEGASQKVVVE